MHTREIPLIWAKLPNSRWCNLLDLNLDLIHVYGVYVIWHGGYPSRIVRVGHGDLATELQACRRDPRVMAYLSDGPLMVTWAIVDACDAAGVHLYLEDRLRPLIAERAASGVSAVAAHSPF